VLSRAEAASQLELPPDRIGDLIIISLQDTTLGTSRSRHDLSGLDVPLRSHGGLSEQQVPLLANRPLKSGAGERRWRNFDAFDLGLNLVA
jgi:phosphonoacetate hydrolase